MRRQGDGFILIFFFFFFALQPEMCLPMKSHLLM